MTVPVNRVRAWRPKVRTGCKTCRQRRVKCDEAKPVCGRCNLAGVTCAGYGHPAARPAVSTPPVVHPKARSPESALQLMVHVPISMVSLTVQESSAVEFFQLQTISVLPGSAWAVSWECIIFQIVLTYNEPGLVHALAALGAVHRADALLAEGLSTDGREQQRLSLVQSNKAMYHIGRYIQNEEGNDSERRVEVILLAALLFFSFEMLQGQYTRAVMHVQTGQRILSDRYTENIDFPSPAVTADKQTRRVIMIKSMRRDTIDVLTQSFLRLAQHPGLRPMGEAPLTPACREPIPSFFGSLEEALVHLDCLLAQYTHIDNELTLFTHRQLAEGGDGKVSDHAEQLTHMLENTLSRVIPLDTYPALMSSITDLQQAVSAWMLALRLSLLNTDDSVPYLLARIESLCLHVQAEALRDPNEMIIDRFQHCFEHIVALGERLLDFTQRTVAGRAHKSGRRLSFAIGTRLFHVLGYVVGRCRQSVVRRRALRLIRRTVMHGLFDNRLVADCLELVVNMEERGACSDPCASLDFDPPAVDIPEHARFLNVSVHLTLQPSRDGSEVANLAWVTGNCEIAGSLEIHKYVLEKKYD